MTNTINFAAALTEAWLGNPNTRATANDVPAFFLAAHAAVAGLEASTAPPQPSEDQKQQHTPTVSVRASLADPDRIVSMINGKPFTSLRRHLTANGLTPDQYRERYGLKPDYPMVAPGYTAARSALSKSLGLGGSRWKKDEAVAATEPVQPAKEPRRKLSIAGAKAAARKHLGGS